MRRVLITLALLALSGSVFGARIPYAVRRGDTLSIGNSLIERRLVWTDKGLRTLFLEDKFSGKIWLNSGSSPDFQISGTAKAEDFNFSFHELKADGIRKERLEAVAEYSLGDLRVRRVYTVYPDSPAISCLTFLRGSGAVSSSGEKQISELGGIESSEAARATIGGGAIIDQLRPGGMHWKARAVEFQDVTDWNNNLVYERNFIPYRRVGYRGNILIARDMTADGGIFMIKESPCSSSELAYGGSDFYCEAGAFQATGLGVTDKDLSDTAWTRAYGVATGLWTGDEACCLKAIRLYQKDLRLMKEDRDEMVMMNTWGDRSQDSKVNEAFCLAEIKRAAALGITHFQIDDGWQSGKSPNSKLAKGSFKNIWDNPDYWEPDSVKYPRGLKPVVDYGRGLGVEVCLWFNPSVQDDFADWEKDASTLVKLYRSAGVRTFKIDGLQIPTKKAETNLRRFFDRVLAETGNDVVFNLDVTAGRRGGYHMFQEYGNIFLENRYTDWGNYYPWQTLRNLWMLSRYVPAERLQVEFLNKWRNADKYGDDPFAPARYDFETLFAITMAGEPLAWMEATGLPDKALALSGAVMTYRAHMHDFHSGIILPVGNEPDGAAWTGFESLSSGRGYLLFFREASLDAEAVIPVDLPDGASFEKILGEGKVKVRKGVARVSIPKQNGYVMFRYTER